MYDVHTPLSSTDYKFTYEEALAKSGAGFGGAWWWLLILREARSSPNVGSTSKSTKGKRLGALFRWFIRYHRLYVVELAGWLTISSPWCMRQATARHSSYCETQPYVYGDYSIFSLLRLLHNYWKYLDRSVIARSSIIYIWTPFCHSQPLLMVVVRLPSNPVCWVWACHS